MGGPTQTKASRPDAEHTHTRVAKSEPSATDLTQTSSLHQFLDNAEEGQTAEEYESLYQGDESQNLWEQRTLPDEDTKPVDPSTEWESENLRTKPEEEAGDKPTTRPIATGPPVSEWSNEEVLVPGEHTDDETTTQDDHDFSSESQTLFDQFDEETRENIIEQVDPTPSRKPGEFQDPIEVQDAEGFHSKYDEVETEETPDLPPEIEEQPQALFIDNDLLPEEERLDSQVGPSGNYGETQEALEPSAQSPHLTDAPDDNESPQMGNLSNAEQRGHRLKLSKPDRGDIELGNARHAESSSPNLMNFSKGGDNSTRLGGLPSDPNAKPPKDDVGEDGFAHEPTSISEMEEGFLARDLETEQLNQRAYERHGGQMDSEAGEKEAARVSAIRDAIENESKNHQRVADMDKRWESYEPELTSVTIGDETVSVAKETPRVPETPDHKGYDSARTEVIFDTFSDTLKSSIDEHLDPIAEKSGYSKREVKEAYSRNLEDIMGTRDSESIETLPDRYESSLGVDDPIEAVKKTKSEIYVGKEYIGTARDDSKYGSYRDVGSTTVSVSDIKNIAPDYVRTNPSDEDVGEYENRNYSSVKTADIEVEVDAEVSRSQIRSNNANQELAPRNVFYASDPYTDSNEQIKVTVYDSAENTNEIAASNNAERDASGRTMDQTKDIPLNFNNGDRLTLRNAEIDSYYKDGERQYTAVIKRRADSDIEVDKISPGNSKYRGQNLNSPRTIDTLVANPSDLSGSEPPLDRVYYEGSAETNDFSLESEFSRFEDIWKRQHPGMEDKIEKRKQKDSSEPEE